MSNDLKESRSEAGKRLLQITQAALIAAMYVALTFVFQPISFGAIQVRIAETLTILPLFTTAAVPGLFVGCLLGNILGGAMLPDILLGSLATLLGAVGTRFLRKRFFVLGTIPPILSNTLIIPFILKYAYGMEMSIPFLMLTIFVGEVLSCGVLGSLLALALKKRPQIFKSESREKK